MSHVIVIWSEGCYVSTVRLNEVPIKKYIQAQESHDIAIDRLSVKEYEDPFKEGTSSTNVFLRPVTSQGR